MKRLIATLLLLSACYTPTPTWYADPVLEHAMSDALTFWGNPPPPREVTVVVGEPTDPTWCGESFDSGLVLVSERYLHHPRLSDILAHEVGHQLGYQHTPNGIMSHWFLHSPKPYVNFAQ